MQLTIGTLKDILTCLLTVSCHGAFWNFLWKAL